MKIHLFPRFSKPLGSNKRVVYAAAAVVAAIGCLGVVLAEADFYVPPASGSSTDVSAWVNQQIQAGQASTQTAATSQSGIGTSVSQSSTTVLSQSGTSTGCGSVCPSQGQVNTGDDTSVTVTAACDPFAAAYGKQVTLVLDDNLALTGILVMECRGFLVLKAVPCTCTKTLVVSIQKLVYMETD